MEPEKKEDPNKYGREEFVADINELKKLMVNTGMLKEDDPWDSLDNLWKGCDINIDEITIVSDEMMETVRTAYAQGKADQEVISKALSIFQKVIPLGKLLI